MAAPVESITMQKADAPSLFRKLRRAAWLAYCFFSYSHVGPLLEKGLQNNIDELSAKEFHPRNFAAADLLNKFNAIHDPMKVTLPATINLRPLQGSLSFISEKGAQGKFAGHGMGTHKAAATQHEPPFRMGRCRDWCQVNMTPAPPLHLLTPVSAM